jgi:hypothetical protein
MARAKTKVVWSDDPDEEGRLTGALTDAIVALENAQEVASTSAVARKLIESKPWNGWQFGTAYNYTRIVLRVMRELEYVTFERQGVSKVWTTT